MKFVFYASLATLILLANIGTFSSFGIGSVSAGSKDATTDKEAKSNDAPTDDEADIESEDDQQQLPIDETGGGTGGTAGEDEESGSSTIVTGSPDVDAKILFTQPIGGTTELPANQLVEFLVGFSNKGDQAFTVDTIDASFRYPLDFSYHMQNFTTIAYGKQVQPEQQATFYYAFLPADAFAGRTFGLVVQLNYRDEIKQYTQAVYNETIQVVEKDEGFDGETFFLYVFLVAIVILVLVGLQHMLAGMTKKRRGGHDTSRAKKTQSNQAIETGTTSNGDVDYEWIPKSTLNEFRRAANQTNHHQRKGEKVKRAAGASSGSGSE